MNPENTSSVNPVSQPPATVNGKNNKLYILVIVLIICILFIGFFVVATKRKNSATNITSHMPTVSSLQKTTGRMGQYPPPAQITTVPSVTPTQITNQSELNAAYAQVKSLNPQSLNDIAQQNSQTASQFSQ